MAMLAEVTYTVCVRREAGHCGISWRPVSPSTTTPDSFDLDSALTVGTGVRFKISHILDHKVLLDSGYPQCPSIGFFF